jgi:hypothetical protein
VGSEFASLGHWPNGQSWGKMTGSATEVVQTSVHMCKNTIMKKSNKNE